VHESEFLDKTTPAGHRSLLKLSWAVDVESCESPISFTMDIAVTIQGRDARSPSRLMNLLSSTRLLTKATALFSVRLIPFKPKKTAEMWRLNTAAQYVRGEEMLGQWRPRSLTLVKDHERQAKMARRSADVDATQSILAALDREKLIAAPEGWAEEAYMRKIIDLWMKKFGAQGEIILAQEPAIGLSIFSDVDKPKLASEVRLVSRSDAAAKKGYMSLLRDPTSDRWTKQFFVLKRPYLYLYDSSSEIEELGVINLSCVRVEYSPEIELMLNRKFVFAMYTAQNCYFFQAPNAKEMEVWLGKVDPSWIPSPV